MSHKRTILKVFGCVFLIGVTYYSIRRGYKQDWTGFQGYVNSKGESIPSKKLWDWLQLLIVPLVLTIGVWYLNKSQKLSDQRVETDRQRQKSLEDYFDCMSDLLLKEELRERRSEAMNIARTRSLAIFKTLDGNRKGQALQFLVEARLLDKNPIVDLCGADLSGAELAGATLRNVELRGVSLAHANLSGANLNDSDLRGSDFTNANVDTASFEGADLTQAILLCVKTNKANFSNAVLAEAELPHGLI